MHLDVKFLNKEKIPPKKPVIVKISASDDSDEVGTNPAPKRSGIVQQTMENNRINVDATAVFKDNKQADSGPAIGNE